MFSTVVRLWIFALTVLALHLPKAAYGEGPKVYFEKECLALFAAHQAPAQMSENETKVEEGQGLIRFEKVIVTETRDGVVADTYIQIRDCHSLEAAGQE